MMLHPQNRLGSQYSYWWRFDSVVQEPDQDGCPLPIQMIWIDIDYPDPWKSLLV